MLAMSMNIQLFDMRWGLLSPSPTSACLHCGRIGAMHAGACWDDPWGQRLDAAPIA